MVFVVIIFVCVVGCECMLIVKNFLIGCCGLIWVFLIIFIYLVFWIIGIYRFFDFVLIFICF